VVHANQDDSAFILTGSISRPKEPRVLLQQYRAFLAKNGIKYHRFHALRHTFATRCIEHGYDPKTLSEILGNKNVKTTLQLYVHPTMSRKRELIEALSPFSAAKES
jgi:site-specific recombinase XerD